MPPPKFAERLQKELAAQKARAKALQHLHATGSGLSQRELAQQQQLRQKQTANTTSIVAQRRVFGAQELSASKKGDPRIRDNTLHVLALQRAQELQKTQYIEQSMNSNRFESTLAEDQCSATPVGWKEIVDSESGDVYYWNEATNETVWERPENLVVPTIVEAAQTKTEELVDGWEAVRDAASGDIYYWNQKTNETTWVRPIAQSVSLSQALEAKAKLDNILKSCGKIGDMTNAKVIDKQPDSSKSVNKRIAAAVHNDLNVIASHGHEQKRLRLDTGANDAVKPTDTGE